MILSAATSALNTVAAMGYSLDIPEWFLYVLGLGFLFASVIFILSTFGRYIKYLHSKDPEA